MRADHRINSNAGSIISKTIDQLRLVLTPTGVQSLLRT